LPSFLNVSIRNLKQNYKGETTPYYLLRKIKEKTKNIKEWKTTEGDKSSLSKTFGFPIKDFGNDKRRRIPD